MKHVLLIYLPQWAVLPAAMDGWNLFSYYISMDELLSIQLPPPPLSVNLSVTKLIQHRGSPSHINGGSSKRQWFSKCLLLLLAAVSKTIFCLIYMDGEREGGWWCFFHIYLQISLGVYISASYLIWVTSGCLKYFQTRVCSVRTEARVMRHDPYKPS